VFSEKKLEEKLDYMHLNPVRRGLVLRAVDWKWSSARWYLQRKSVGIKIQMPGL
jgi:putative transposase